MAEDGKDLKEAQKPIDPVAEKAAKFAKDPDMFVDITELVMAARLNSQGQIEIMIGQGSIDTFLHVRARLDDKVDDIVNYLKAVAMQEKQRVDKIAQGIKHPGHGIMDFARRGFKH
jgi:hypothetical protein